MSIFPSHAVSDSDFTKSEAGGASCIVSTQIQLFMALVRRRLCSSFSGYEQDILVFETPWYIC